MNEGRFVILAYISSINAIVFFVEMAEIPQVNVPKGEQEQHVVQEALIVQAQQVKTC